MPKGGGFVAQITAPRELERIGRELKASGNGKLKREIAKDLRLAAEPTAERMRQAAMSIPAKGPDTGLRKRLARSIKVRVSFSGKNAGVSIISSRAAMLAGQKRIAKAFNTGKIRHPVFGTDVWVDQIVAGGRWFDDAAKEGAPLIRAAVARSIKRASERLN